MPTPVADRSVVLLGTTIRYRQLGAVDPRRPVLLLLHGIGDSSRTWDSVFDVLAGRPARGRPTVIAVDMLGHGGSSKPRTDYSLGAHANVLRDLLDHLGIAHVVLVGHSLGGGIAMQFVYQYPERVQGLMLESTGGLGPDVFGLLRAAALPGANTVIRIASATLFSRALDLTVGTAVRAARAARVPVPRDSDDVVRVMRSLVDVDARAAFLSTLKSVIDPAGQRVSALSKLTLAAGRPIVLVWGDRDPIIPLAHGDAAARLLPDARLEVFVGAGHFPHSADPERFAQLLVAAERDARAQAAGAPGRSGRSGRSSTPRSSRADMVTSNP